MGIHRVYFDKNNTIIKDSEVNTGQNPVAELSYGSKVTRFLFTVDITKIRQLIEEGNAEDYTIKLRMKNTQEFSVLPYLDEFKQIQLDSTTRPTSFDLELYGLQNGTYFEEGVGYDFTQNNAKRPEDKDYVTGVSNWINSQNNTPWPVPGAIDGSAQIITSQHFDKGNEDLDLDITSWVITNINASGATLNFVLKYSDGDEESGGDTQYTTGFFTRHTQTYFEPFIELVIDDVISDDRNRFYLNKENDLYLYVNIDGQPTNLDSNPSVTIATDEGPSILTSVRVAKGVYKVTVDATEESFTTYKKYYDVWSGLKVNNNTLKNVKMSFIPKDESEGYVIGDEMGMPQRYGLSLSGIKQEEKITSGEIRRVNVLVRKPYTVNQVESLSGVEYRMYVKIGPAQLTVIDWRAADRSNLYNFFMLDTSWMIPNKYYIDIRINQNGETLLYNDQLVFNIVSRKKL